MTDRTRWYSHLNTGAFAAFLMSRIALLAYAAPQSDVLGIYYEPVARPFWLEGALPYLDTGFPYPPVALLPVLLPGLWRTDFPGYYLAFQFQMLVADILTCVLMVRLIRRQPAANDSRVRRAILAYTALSFGVAVVIYDRLDILVALSSMVVANLYRADSPQRVRYYAALALGGLFKIVPLFWLPFGAMRDWWHAGRGRWRWRWLVACALPAAMVIVATALIGVGRDTTSVNDHVLRPIEIESVWATPLVLTRWLGITPNVRLTTSFGSTNIVGAPAAFVTLSRYAGFCLLGAFYLAWFRRTRRWPEAPPSLAHTRFVIAVLLILMATQRVLSPQYFLWLLPGLALHIALARQPAAIAVASAGMYGLTFVLFPIGFGSLRAFEVLGVLALTVRNALLVGLAVWAARDVLGAREGPRP